MTAAPGRPRSVRHPPRPPAGQPRDQLAGEPAISASACTWAKSFVAQQLDVAYAAGTGFELTASGRPEAVGGDAPRRQHRALDPPELVSGSSVRTGVLAPKTAPNANSKRSRSTAWRSTARFAARAARPRARPRRPPRGSGARSASRRARRASPAPACAPRARRARVTTASASAGATGSDTFEHPSLRSPGRTSSWTFSAAPSVSSRSASSPSASSACAHTIVSPTPGSLYRSPWSRSRADRRHDPHRDRARGRPGSARGRSRARDPGSGSRSSDRGSGA